MRYIYVSHVWCERCKRKRGGGGKMRKGMRWERVWTGRREVRAGDLASIKCIMQMGDKVGVLVGVAMDMVWECNMRGERTWAPQNDAKRNDNNKVHDVPLQHMPTTDWVGLVLTSLGNDSPHGIVLPASRYYQHFAMHDRSEYEKWKRARFDSI